MSFILFDQRSPPAVTLADSFMYLNTSFVREIEINRCDLYYSANNNQIGIRFHQKGKYAVSRSASGRTGQIFTKWFRAYFDIRTFSRKRIATLKGDMWIIQAPLDACDRDEEV